VKLRNSHELRFFFVSSECSTFYRQMSLTVSNLIVLPAFVQFRLVSFVLYRVRVSCRKHNIRILCFVFYASVWLKLLCTLFKSDL